MPPPQPPTGLFSSLGRRQFIFVDPSKNALLSSRSHTTPAADRANINISPLVTDFFSFGQMSIFRLVSCASVPVRNTFPPPSRKTSQVVPVEHDLGRLNCVTGKMACGTKQLGARTGHEDRGRKSFLRELQAMIRLRSPHTVNVFGAVTSRQDRLVLVMELLPGGDLHALLKGAVEPLAEEHARRIIGDICAGMSFLHQKETIHGDFKSPNVLLDGDGRAKVTHDIRKH